jgi:hypothetical protein
MSPPPTALQSLIYTLPNVSKTSSIKIVSFIYSPLWDYIFFFYPSAHSSISSITKPANVNKASQKTRPLIKALNTETNFNFKKKSYSTSTIKTSSPYTISPTQIDLKDYSKFVYSSSTQNTESPSSHSSTSTYPQDNLSSQYSSQYQPIYAPLSWAISVASLPLGFLETGSIPWT